MEIQEYPAESLNLAFLEEVERESGVKVSACYQCRKCTSGCPVTFAMDLYPDQVMAELLSMQMELIHILLLQASMELM